MKLHFIFFLFILPLLPCLGEDQPDRIPKGYSVRTIQTPPEVFLGIGGMEFCPDGNLFVCTREGEVWKYILEDKEWSLFADGLHEALGIWIDPKISYTKNCFRTKCCYWKYVFTKLEFN